MITLLLFFSLLTPQPTYTTFTANPLQIRMFWKDKNGNGYQSFSNLHAQNKLSFSMNGGMFTEDYQPLGLYIEDGRTLRKIKYYNNPSINFGIQPQGVFYITFSGKAGISSVSNFSATGVRYATQSAPILVSNGNINPKLPTSLSRVKRNGAGILKDGNVLMVVSDTGVTFREFAQFFIDKGCTSALFLDGGVSKCNLQKKKSRFRTGYGVFIGVL